MVCSYSPAITDRTGVSMFSTWYDEIDQIVGTTNFAVRYGMYYLSTLVAISAIAWIISRIAFLAWQQVPSATTVIATRHERAAQLAREHSDGTPLFRSQFSKALGPSECLEDRARKRWETAASLQKQVTEAEIRRWVIREDLAHRAYCRSRSAFRAFGGTYPDRMSLRQLTRPAAAILAAVILMQERPLLGARQAVRNILGSTSELIDSGSLSRAFPILLFIFGVSVTLVRSSRILDGIRARDEAAKDANRLLLELCGALLRAHYGLHSWTRWLTLNRTSIVSEWVRRASGSTYEWDSRGGVRKIIRFRYAHLSTDSCLNVPEGNEIDAQIDQIAQIGRRIDGAGLALVCNRITQPVTRQLAFMGLNSWHRCEPERLRPWFAAPSELRIYFDRHLDRWADLSELPSDDDHNGDDCYRLQELEERAFRWALQIDLAIARAIMTERECRTVAIFLNKRVHGNLVTRAASTIQK